MYIIYLYKYYITSILLNNDTTWNEKHLSHMMLLYSVPGLGELLNHWQQFQRLQRAIAVLQVETMQDSERSNFYNFTFSPKIDSILSDSNHQLRDLFAICHQCQTACIYTCQQLFDFGCLQSFLIQLGEKVQTRLLKGVAGELVYKGLRQSLRLNQTRSTQGVILYSCPLLCEAKTTLWLRVPTTPRRNTEPLEGMAKFPKPFQSLDFGRSRFLYVVISCANLHKSIMWLKGEVQGQWAFVRYLKSKNFADNTKSASSSMKLDHWYKPKNEKRSSTLQHHISSPWSFHQQDSSVC